MSGATPSKVGKPHRCPTPNDVEHCSNRWETAFCYSFITKFTALQSKVEGLETASDFERAIMSQTPNTTMTRLITSLIVTLRPSTRLNPDQISKPLANAVKDLLEKHKDKQTVYWDDQLEINVNPFLNLDGGFWTSPWQFKLKLVRQLVEWQLSDNLGVKHKIDVAWGFGNKNKKKELIVPPPPPEDPLSKESLTMAPIGQDKSKKRYWVVDDSPRVYSSSNPWRLTCPWEAVCSDLQEYNALIATLKASAPPDSGSKMSKLDQGHLSLIDFLEGRLDTITAEVSKLQKARRKVEQKAILQAQAEIRESRPRRENRRMMASASAAIESDEDEDHEREDMDEFIDDEDDEPSRHGTRTSTRRSTRNGNGKRAAASAEDPFMNWRGERRSTRLGNAPEIAYDEEAPRPSKRARTEESTASVGSGTGEASTLASAASSTTKGTASRPSRYAVSGASALKANEVPVEQVAGKKKGKYWFYAVEPVAPEVEPAMNGDGNGNGNGASSSTGRRANGRNGHVNGAVKQEKGEPVVGGMEEDMNVDVPAEEEQPDSPRSVYAKSLEGSLSPMNAP